MALFSKLCLLLLLSFALAYDLSERKLLGGELGVELDYDFARFRPEGQENDNSVSYKKRNWVYSSHLTFNEYVSSIPDGQLRTIAQNAFNEMKQVMIKYGLTAEGGNTPSPAQTPVVMTILAFGKEIILSSSQKGKDTFVMQWGHSPVRSVLERCQASHRERNPGASDRHANGAGCGEVMAVDFFYHLHPATPVFPTDGRILAIQKARNKVGYVDKPPCPGNDEKTNEPITDSWGCREFVEKSNLNVIPEGVAEPYGMIDDLAGGLVSKDHVPLQCNEHP